MPTWSHYLSALAFVGLAVLLLAGGMLAASASYADSTHELTENDTVTVSYDESVAVSPTESATSYYDDVTVWNDSGSQLDRGTDYTWNTSTGSVDFANTSATTNGSTATVRFRYEGRAHAVEGMRDLQTQLFGVLPYAVIFLAVAIALVGLLFVVAKIVLNDSGTNMGF